MAIQSYRDLVAWQKAMELAETVYHFSQHFPECERFGLTNQIRRAGVSVPSNIAEGQGRGSAADFNRFLGIANGSRQEIETQATLAFRLGFATEQSLQTVICQTEELGRVLTGLRRSLG